jgi:Cof subfamily protein (haloacid dehalogenase superfamily)
MNQLNIRLIALDLDDTLLTETLTISPYTVEVLAHAAERGIYVLLASGRTNNAVLPTLRLLGPRNERRRYLLTQNGAVVRELELERNIYEKRIAGDVLIKAYQAGKGAGMSFQVYDDDTIYSPEMTKWTEQDYRLSSLRIKIDADYEALLKKGWPKMVLSLDAEKMPPAMERVKDAIGEGGTIYLSKPYFLELMSPGIGKGETMLWLADRLGIGQEQTMAFGDSMNDESMIRLAGHGVAMKNGRAEIRSMAKHVTDYTNNEDGVARYIERYVL